ncbi:MAG TPA: transcriptional regulator [Xanthobacteraceae bacterium]|nr:transcriptional regulator [Xanthobacteraceae bacterium]
MATRASEARATETKSRAEANFKKEERAKEGAKAMLEYQANGRAIREQMARLKALRLAKEAADAAAAVPPQEEKKPRRGKR